MSKIMAKGIDVSTFQKNIDWAKVKASGQVDFAILRAGFGKNNVDKTFHVNAKGCIANDIPFGVYWFIYGINEAEAVKNAEKCHETIKAYKDKIEVKVWCDFEYDTETNAKSRGVIFTKDIRAKMVVAFCEKIKQYGYEVGVYANPDYIKNRFNDLSKYPLWLAQYADNKAYDCEIWQYSSKGRIDGIDGNVDMNYAYVKYKKSNNPYKIPAKTLYLGNSKMTEEDIKWLQWELVENGYNMEIDGVFTKTTQAILRDYQHNHGLEVDGKCGNLTRTDMIANKA